jgi:hypothetical protein
MAITQQSVNVLKFITETNLGDTAADIKCNKLEISLKIYFLQLHRTSSHNFLSLKSFGDEWRNAFNICIFR